MIDWTYDSKPITDIYQLPSSVYGFVYMLVYNTGCAYIGQKSLYSYKTLPALKNGTQRPNSVRVAHNKNGKRVYFDKVQKESNWKIYTSSSKDIPQEAIITERHILELAYSKRELTYLETKLLFQYEVLESDKFYNLSILGKFYQQKGQS